MAEGRNWFNRFVREVKSGGKKRSWEGRVMRELCERCEKILGLEEVSARTGHLPD